MKFLKIRLFAIYSDYFSKIIVNFSILIKTVTFFILLLLSFIKYIKTLALWSVFSQLSLLFAFSIIAWLDVSNYFLTKNLTIEYFNFNNSLFFIAACVYCYEGAGVVLSLESATSPTIRFGFKRILNCAIFVFFMVNCSFGISGYLSFGKDTQSIITLNLEYKDSHLLHLLNLVKFLICISLMLTFPIIYTSGSQTFLH
ncbi:hypothetical protein A3Q56_07879 [Intoshia linei]|uniref:Amino acid transporter transmembrane domain-containing protein n=1 Tax=Intoshia linei TaxID=1819745 RepID=A0A177AQX0_9BILA|nr:hypothetical protein A3Q56_07879 [Intoshia linei]